MKIETKKIIAREIIILFGIVILLSIFLFGLILYNWSYKRSIEGIRKEVSHLQDEISNMPKNRIWNLYSQINESLVKNYKVDDSEYAIPMNKENEFLTRFPNAQKLPPERNKYCISGVDIYFDYVEYDEFRRLLEDSLYRINFYHFITENYDIGSHSEYEEGINEGFLHNDSIESKITEYFTLIEDNNTKIIEKNNKIIERQLLQRIYLIVVIIILIFAYPIRLSINVIKWAFKTLNK